MLHDQFREERAIHAPRHVVPRRNREKGSRVVVETDRIVEAGRPGYLWTNTHHPVRTVVKTTRRPELQAWIMPGQRRQLPAVGRLVQREKNNRQIALVAEL